MKAWGNGIGISLVLWALIFWAAHAFAADLPLPKPRPVVAAPVIEKPVKKPAERCLIAGQEPAPGQTLHVDKRCKSGLRWVFQR